MFCPRCGQERISQETSFCSRCGFLLTAAAALLSTGGSPLQPSVPSGISPMRHGIRRGLFMFLLMFVFAPLLGIISQFGLGMEPWPAGVAVLLFGGGGLLRIVYAVLFESKYPQGLPAGVAPHIAGGPILGANPAQSALPPQRNLAASEYTTPKGGRWLETSDLEPSSVTENTIRLLEKEK